MIRDDEANSRETEPVATGTEAFFTGIRERLRGTTESVLLCIPMWGHLGDGKTTALITALHYADAATDAVGLRFVKDPELLAGLEARDEYHGLNLRSLAVATREQLGELEAEFIDRAKWPRGTDVGSHYLLELDNTVGSPIFCLFPDLTGGSFEENDDEARTALARSHAWGLLVDASRYCGVGTKSKNYRDDVRATIQKAVRDKVPFCVMITKSDRHDGETSMADTAHAQVTAFINQLETKVANTVVRVSVTGVPVDVGGDPRPASVREPRELVKAYAWLIDQALREPSRLRAVIPTTKSVVARSAEPAIAMTAELRRVAQHSGAHGRPICDCSDDPKKRLVAFLLEDGTLTEVSVPTRTGEEPVEKSIGTMSDFDVPLGDVQAEYVGGELMVASFRQPKYLWLGRKGELRRTSFAQDVFAWSPVTNRRLIALDNGGRIHSLRLTGDRWQATDTIDDVGADDGTGGACQVVAGRRVVVGCVGAVISIAIESDDRLGARSAAVALANASSFRGSRQGLVCTMVEREGASVIVALNGSVSQEVGTTNSSVVAVAPDSNALAWVESDGTLAAAIVDQTGKLIRTDRATANDAVVETLCWTGGGEALVALLEGGTWEVYMPKGLTR